MNKMTKRIVFGSILIAVLAGLLVLDAWLESSRTVDAPGVVVMGVLVVLTTIGFVELSSMIRSAGGAVLEVSGLLGCLATAASPYWLPLVGLKISTPLWGLFLVAMIVLGVFLEQMIRYRKDGAVMRLGGTMLALGYLGVGMAMILHVRVGYGMGMLVLYIATVKFTDIGAYFTGTLIGRHKIIPWLSPGKSWEGLAGGIAFATGICFALNALLKVGLVPGVVVAFAVTAAVGGQFGDLCESLLKRSADMKDSGSLVPEFGGVLDMIDSPILAAAPILAVLSVGV